MIGVGGVFMTPVERVRLAVLKNEIRRLGKQFEKKKNRRDAFQLEASDLKRVLDALEEEKALLEQGQLLLRNVG
jgi:hypothetical protein